MVLQIKKVEKHGCNFSILHDKIQAPKIKTVVIQYINLELYTVFDKCFASKVFKKFSFKNEHLTN